MMSDFSIVIHEGPLSAEDNSTYLTDQVDVVVEYLNQEERPYESVKYAVFVPKNGNARFVGSLMKVPFDRVVMIVDHTQRP